MSSFLPPDEPPTIARNPSRSLWEAALVGHREAFAQLAGRTAQAVYARFRADGATPAEALARTEHFFVRLQTVERPNAAVEDVERLQGFLIQRLAACVEARFPEAPETLAEVRPVFDHEQAERRFLRVNAQTPDDVFTRRWALGTLELTLETLREEMGNEGKAGLFPHLPQFLSFSGSEERYAEISEQCGTSVSGLHVAVYRFRLRYREILRRLAGDTVRSAEEVDSELTKLLVAAS